MAEFTDSIVSVDLANFTLTMASRGMPQTKSENPQLRMLQMPGWIKSISRQNPISCHAVNMLWKCFAFQVKQVIAINEQPALNAMNQSLILGVNDSY